LELLELLPLELLPPRLLLLRRRRRLQQNRALECTLCHIHSR
jgi:hypothetical protein